jgi:hypothetical protein
VKLKLKRRFIVGQIRSFVKGGKAVFGNLLPEFCFFWVGERNRRRMSPWMMGVFTGRCSCSGHVRCFFRCGKCDGFTDILRGANAAKGDPRAGEIPEIVLRHEGRVVLNPTPAFHMPQMPLTPVDYLLFLC